MTPALRDKSEGLRTRALYVRIAISKSLPGVRLISSGTRPHVSSLPFSPCRNTSRGPNDPSHRDSSRNATNVGDATYISQLVLSADSRFHSKQCELCGRKQIGRDLVHRDNFRPWASIRQPWLFNVRVIFDGTFRLDLIDDRVRVMGRPRCSLNDFPDHVDVVRSTNVRRHIAILWRVGFRWWQNISSDLEAGIAPMKVWTLIAPPRDFQPNFAASLLRFLFPSFRFIVRPFSI